MEDIDDLRRKNLRSEATRLGGDAELARVLGKDKNQIYQWLRSDDPKQQRTMRKKMARDLEVKLGRPHGWLDQVHNHGVAEASPPGYLSPEFPAIRAEVRAKNDMRAVRYALQSLFSVLHEKQPAVALAVAEDIVETAGTQFAGQGFLNTLVGTLRGVDDMSEEAAEATPQVQAAPASRRVASGVKRP